MLSRPLMPLVVQLLNCVWLFLNSWTIACYAPLSSIISWSLLKFLSIQLMTLSNHLVLCHSFSFCLQSFLASGSFPVSQLFTSGGQTIGAFASVSVLPMYIQGGFPLRLTGVISCCSRDAQKSFQAPQFKRISSLRFCLLYGPTLTLCMTPGKTIALTILWLCRQRVYNHKSSKRVTPFWLFCQDGLRRINSSF